MSSFLQPSFNSALFNSNAFAGSGFITKQEADLLYLNTASGKKLYLLDVIDGVSQVSRALTYNSAGVIDQVKVSRASGDCLSIDCTDTNGRATLLCTAPGNSVEIGVRGNAASSYPSSYYRYANGSYRYVMNTASGDSQQFGRATIDTSGSHLSLKNGSNIGFMEQTASNILRTVAGISVNQDANGVRIDSIGNTNSARSRLDLGSSASDRTLSIFNSTTAFYGLSANNNQLQFSSNSAFAWYSNCSDASPINTVRMSLAANGVLSLTENLIAQKGLFVQQSSFSSSGRTGVGIAMHCTNSTYGECFGYDYSGMSMKSLYLSNMMYLNGVGGTVNIGGGPNPSLYPLTVNGSSSGSIGTYGFLNSSGTTGSTSVNPVPISIYAANRVACTEVNAYSDERLKEAIKDIDEEEAISFIRNLKAKSYHWKNETVKRQSYGFIAQDILKLDIFTDLICHTEDPDLEEVVEIIEDRKFVSPKGQRLNISYQSIIPLLHSGLASAFDLIEDLQDRLDELEAKQKNKAKK